MVLGATPKSIADGAHGIRYMIHDGIVSNKVMEDAGMGKQQMAKWCCLSNIYYYYGSG